MLSYLIEQMNIGISFSRLHGLFRLLSIIFFFSAILTSNDLMSQSIGDLSSIKVDLLTDQQIEDLLIKAETLGVSQDRLIALARQRGMLPAEHAKFERRVIQVSNVRLRREKREESSAEALRKTQRFGSDNLFESITGRDSLGYELTGLEKKIFGYSIFHNKPLDFSPNLNMPTPKNYILGPGDEVVINIYGATTDNFKEIITPDGKINMKLIGLIHIGGLSVEAAISTLTGKLATYYSGLRGNNPNTFLSLTVGNVRTIKVNIVGEVKSPGTYSLPSMSTVFNALYAAGGPTTNGTFRHIQVYRSGKLVTEVDTYPFLTKGDDSTNVRLEDNDVILVRPISNRVEVIGATRIQGLFEVRPHETLKDLIYFSGGFTELAFTEMITVTRMGDNMKTVETLDGAQQQQFFPRDGDIFTIGEIQDRFSNRVQVQGPVVRPGQYELTDGLTVTELVKKAGGLQGDAFLSRATLYRTSENFTLKAASIDLGAILEGKADDLPLQNEDLLSIVSIFDLREEYSVEVSGEVNKAGNYPYAENMTIGDLLLRAGGLKESAANSIIEIARRVSNDNSGKIASIITLPVNNNLSIADEEREIILSPFDHVFVRKSPGYQEQKLVTIEGEVNYPGEYALDIVTMRISDLVKRAGGLNQFAYAKGATLLRRTEYYEPKPEEEIRLEKLTDLQANTLRKDAENIESEKKMLERVDANVTKGKEALLMSELNRSDDELLEQARTERLIRTGAVKEKEMKAKEAELVGINLGEIIRNPGSSYDLILKDGDLLTIPKELQTVRLRGEVLYPTTTRYETGKGLKGYIGNAGGFSEVASRKRSYVVYANGEVKRTKRFFGFRFYPQIEPGAEIIVPLAPARRPISIQEIVGLSTSFLTLYLLVNSQVLRN